jgi:hypothetical protein
MSSAVAVVLLALSGELHAETLTAWESYVALTEERIGRELANAESFLLLDSLPPSERTRCHDAIESGRVCILERETLSDEGKEIRVPDGMIHHWYGSVLVPGATLDSVLDWVKTYDDRERYYPEVEGSRLLGRRGDEFRIFLRLKRTKVLTAHYNTEHEVTYRGHGEKRASSRSIATRIRELDHPGSPRETEKPPGEDRGFLWRLNSYWRFEEKDGGTYVECESISLSRDAPPGIRFALSQFIRSVPRESLESTLLPIRKNLSK